MELVQLKAFRIVAKTLSFTKASEELKISQPSVSRQIKSLESDLGVQLFVREKRDIALSEQGKLLLGYAGRVFEELDSLRNELTPENLKDKSLIVGTNLSGLSKPFLHSREGFLENRGDAEVYFKGLSSRERVLDCLKTGEIDVGFVVKCENHHDRFNALKIGEFDVHAVVHPDQRIALLEGTLEPEELIDEMFVFLNEGSCLREKTDHILDSLGLLPTKTYEVDDPGMVLDLVNSGSGIGFLPSWSVGEMINSGSLTELDFGVRFRFTFLAISRRDDDRRVVQEYLNYFSVNPPKGVRNLKAAQTP